jgi:hypothetical protein
MVSAEETTQALTGVLRIARFDRTGALGFGRDLKACKRSFWAYAIGLPATLLLIGQQLLLSQPDQPTLAVVLQLLADVIQAAGFPLLMLPLLRLWGKPERWAWFITGYNWFNLAQTVAFLAVIGLAWDLSGSPRELVLQFVQVYFIVLEAFLADAILEIGGMRAAGIVLLDVILGAIVNGVADAIGGLGS